MSIIAIVLFSLIQSIATSLAQTAPADDQQTLFEYLYSMDGTPVIRIDTDVKKMIRDKRKEEYQPSVISFVMPNGEIEEWPSKLRARGNVRKEVCRYPPLKLNFKEKQLIKNNYDTLDILKLVMQCNTNKNVIKYTRKERLAYQLYEQIDTLFLRTKNIKIELYNNGVMDEELIGFLVETEKHYAARTNCTVAEVGQIRSAALFREHFLKMGFFQYMIGNPDYAIHNMHNVEILQTPDKRLVAVPYDFDYSGLVDTDYSVPHESLPITEVTERIFLHKNVSKEEAVATANYYLSMEDHFYSIIDDADYLEQQDRKDVKYFLKDFFKTLKSERRVEREFVK